MPVTDPIADLLTRIRNASKAKKRRVEIPSSKMKLSLVDIFKQQNFTHDYNLVDDNKQNVIDVRLKYTNDEATISGLKKISKPG